MNLMIKRVIFAIVVSISISSILSGCIADSPEDSDLPWSSNKSWEGIAPIAPSVMDRYD